MEVREEESLFNETTEEKIHGQKNRYVRRKQVQSVSGKIILENGEEIRIERSGREQTESDLLKDRYVPVNPFSLIEGIGTISFHYSSIHSSTKNEFIEECIDLWLLRGRELTMIMITDL